LKVEEFEGWEGASAHGTVDTGGGSYLEDNDASFTDDLLGQWVLCNEQERHICEVTSTKLYVQPAWSKVPESGDEYGKAYFRDLWLCEGIIPYTVDDVLDSILELAGVDRSTVVTASAGDIGGSSPAMHDVDLALDTSASSTTFKLWCSTNTATGEAAYSGLHITVGSASTTLTAVEGLGSASSPYQSTTTLAVHPNMVSVPASGSKTLRIQACDDFIMVSCDGHVVTAFPVYGYWPGGYVGVSNGTASYTEFHEIMDSFIWDANQPANSALALLMRGRRARFLERADGSVAISRFENGLDDAGTYSVPVTQLQTGEDLSHVLSLIEVVGAEERAFYLDEYQAPHAGKSVRSPRGGTPRIGA